MSLVTPRRDFLKVAAAGGAAALLYGAQAGTAAAATAVTWHGYPTADLGSFVIGAAGAKPGSTMRVFVRHRGGRIRTLHVTGSAVSTGYTPGPLGTTWESAYARLYSPTGAPVTTSPTLQRKRPTTTPTVPAPALALGMKTQALRTTFDSLSSIDMGRSGATGFDWYTNYVWQTDRAQDPSKTLSIGTDTDGSHFLHIDPDVSNCNWTISTFDQKTNVGRRFTYGYFEATVRYAQPAVPTVWDPASWPSIWLASVAGMIGSQTGPGAEIDILEALDGPNRTSTGIHEWPGYPAGPTSHHYSLGTQQSHTLGSTWHTFGCTWSKPDATGLAAVTMYIDGVQVWQQYYSPTRVPVAGPGETCYDTPTGGDTTYPSSLPAGTFSCLNSDTMTLVLGTGKGNPMDVKNVQIWTY